MKDSTKAALDDFGEMWDTLPPLARAAIGAWLVERSAIQMDDAEHRATVFKGLDLDRRASSELRIARAHLALAELFRKLVKAGDDEATERGVDKLAVGEEK
jgi:hypothetical protein